MSARVCLRDCAGARENFLNVKPRVYMSLCPRGSHGLAFSGAQALWGKNFFRAPPRGRGGWGRTVGSKEENLNSVTC